MAQSNSLARPFARGLVAAMAMSGMRRVSVNLGLLESTPPDEVAGRKAKRLLRRLSPERREVAIELSHWSYGAAGGALFGLLPEGARRHPATGPVYGIGAWLFFELVLEPLLGLNLPRRRKIATRAMLALDHLLYGVVVAGRLAAEDGVPRGETAARRGLVGEVVG